MNNNNAPAIVRSVIIFAVCIPLAVWLGYLLAAPADRSTFSYGGILALILMAPILLRWHHFLLIAGWNLSLDIFFLPGRPPVWLLLAALSLFISILHRAVNSRAHFISAPEITRPLLFLLAVIIMTAELTGGIGLHSMGSDVSGGKHYILVIFGVLGYFALTALRIPPQRVVLYISLFFLAGLSNVVGDLGAYLPSSMHFLFAIFPASGYDLETVPGMIDFHPRYAGLGSLGVAGFLFILSRYGARGILLSGQPWRWVVFGLFSFCVLFGGFRSMVILCGLTFAVQFYLERMHRTPVMPFFIFAGLLGATLLIPFASKLPYACQRSLAFLPIPIEEAARTDAANTEDWRLQIWQDTLPKVPQYLLLGKGYALSAADLEIASSRNFRYLSSADLVSTAGNYHSGPLSVLMPFGIWGAIGVIWFWFASLRALHDNYRYGDPAFKTINIFLFAYFLVKVFLFLVIFGAIEDDLATFTVLIGLSVSINGGIRRPAPVPLPSVDKAGTAPLTRPRFQPFYQR